MGPSSCGTHEEATFWINSEICGLFCGVTVVYGLIAFAMYTFTFCVIDPWFGITSWKGIINVLLFNFLNALSIYSHFKGMTTDPGAVPNNARPLLSDCDENDYEAQDKVNGNKFKKFCKKCNAFKPKRAHHCSICRRCIIKMDHHCPWFNNCIGIGNQKLFIQFLLWVSVSSIYAIAILITRYVNCSQNPNVSCGTASQNLMSLLLLIESALFGMFTMCMKADQLSVVLTNQTQIDKLKNYSYETKVDINEVFGCPNDIRFQLNWLYPIPVRFRDSVRDEILGYTAEKTAVSSGASYVLDKDKANTMEMAPLLKSGAVTADDDKTVVLSAVSSDDGKISRSDHAFYGVYKEQGAGTEACKSNLGATQVSRNYKYVPDFHNQISAQHPPSNSSIRKRPILI